MLTLYHNDMSSCAQKVRFVLAEKNLHWHSEELNLRRGDQQRPAYLKINPKGLVPALDHDGDILVGSVVTGTGIVGDVTVVTVTDQNNIVLSSAQTLAEDVELTFTGLEVEDTAGNTLFIETLEII